MYIQFSEGKYYTINENSAITQPDKESPFQFSFENSILNVHRSSENKWEHGTNQVLTDKNGNKWNFIISESGSNIILEFTITKDGKNIIDPMLFSQSRSHINEFYYITFLGIDEKGAHLSLAYRYPYDDYYDSGLAYWEQFYDGYNESHNTFFDEQYKTYIEGYKRDQNVLTNIIPGDVFDSIFGAIRGGLSGSEFPRTLRLNSILFYRGGSSSDFYVDSSIIEPDSIDPYFPGGVSKPGSNPPGTFDDTSNPIPDSSLPDISAANTGFTRIYNPTLSQVQDLARYLWTDETVIQTVWNHIKQYFEDPMQAIIGFNLVPVKVPDGGSKNFALMYIDTGVSMNTAANQFVDVDCGTLELSRFYGSALDQSPFTKVSCFLPYIGTVQLNCDEVMGTVLQVKYRVDIVSGSCVAKILVDGNVLYQYSGHCAINIPISSADFSSYVASAISVAKLAIGATVGGVAGALSAVPEAAPQTSQTETVERTTARNVETGRQVITGTKTTTVTETKSPKQTSTKASYSYLSPSNIANTVGQVMSSKPVIQHSGSFSGNTGYLGIRRPFLIVERPNMCLPEQYQHFNGYPAMITMALSDCKGFTRIQQVQLTGLSATNPEQAEIMGLLKSGVYL